MKKKKKIERHRFVGPPENARALHNAMLQSQEGICSSDYQDEGFSLRQSIPMSKTAHSGFQLRGTMIDAAGRPTTAIPNQKQVSRGKS